MKKLEFREEQRFRGWDVYLWLVFFTVALVYRALEGLAVETAVSAPVASYLFFALLMAGLFVYFYSIHLIVKVDEKGIKYQFYPLHFRKRRIRWEEIDQYEVVDLPIGAALNGWTINFSEERRFSVTGRRKGLALQLKNGEHLFIGTKHPEDLEAVIRALHDRG